MILKPGDVGIVGRIKAVRITYARFDWRSRPRIPPAFEFGMSIRKGETARSVVVKTRQIPETVSGRFAWPACHIDRKISHIDAILPHIRKQKGLGRSRL